MSDGRFRDGAPMVRWFQPGQLLSTAAKVIAASARTDYRAIEALGRRQDAFDYRDHDELWLDYVADLGDGWNPTYAVARAMARHELEVEGLDEPLPTARVLLMGGDQVYPCASRDAYSQRFRLPYEAAYPAGEERERDLFVLPGNHDWYDGLRSFVRLFCHERRIGSLQTRQSRSYFALRLPHDWWLMAFDIQLDADVDKPQLNYFAEAVVADMKEGDRVIVCTAAPGWLYGEDSKLAKNFRFLDREVAHAGARVCLWLAGDLHFYMRHTEEQEGGTVHKITSGGGGAFMHPTHGPVIEASRPVARYPDRARSRKLGWWNLLFFIDNPWFAVFLGALFAVFGAALAPALAPIAPALGHVGEAIVTGLGAVFRSPFAMLLALAVVAGSISFAGTDSRFGWIAGPVFGFAMLVAGILASWVSARVAIALPPATDDLLFIETAAYTYVIGGFLGLVVLGMFLAISTSLFGRVLNHGFSALRIEGYKNFVRLRLRPDGAIDVYAIAIDEVPRTWRTTDGDGAERIVPDGDEPARPRVIEQLRIG